MEPKAMTIEEHAWLPSHEIVTYAKDQPQYRQLPVARLEGSEGRVISRWALTPEERAKIVAGEDLYLEQLTFGLPLQPILPTIGLRDFCPRDLAPQAQPSAEDQKAEALKADLSKLHDAIKDVPRVTPSEWEPPLKHQKYQ